MIIRDALMYVIFFLVLVPLLLVLNRRTPTTSTQTD